MQHTQRRKKTAENKKKFCKDSTKTEKIPVLEKISCAAFLLVYAWYELQGEKNCDFNVT